MKRIFYIFSLTFFAGISSADDFDDMFSDDPFTDVDIDTPVAPDRAWALGHDLTLQSIANINSEKTGEVDTRYTGLTSLELAWQPRFSADLTDNLSMVAEARLATDGIFWLRSDDGWSEDDIDARQFQFDAHELTLTAQLDRWQLSSGLQTTTLGLADVLSVADILQARDLSLPGLKDAEDARIPSWTTAVSGGFSTVRFRAGVVHNHTINRLPPAGTDFSTGQVERLEQAGLQYEPEALAVDAMGLFASLSGIAGPLDWQANAVSQLAHSPTVELGLAGMQPVPVAISYPRQNSVAFAASYVTGAVLWKAEAAFTDGLRAQTSVNGGQPGKMIAHQRLAGTLGFDINHSSLGQLIAELQVSQIPDVSELNLMTTDKQSAQWILIYRRSFLRETLTVHGQMLAFDLDASGGRLQGLGLEYSLNDHWRVDFRLLDYVSGDFQYLRAADDRDRLIAQLRYQF